MDFSFTSEQTQLADALKRFLTNEYGFESRKAIIASPTGVSPEAWAKLAELGLLALPIPEDQGGFGGSAVDLLVVMQELGRGLCVEPYLATVVGAEFIKQSGNPVLLAMLEKLAEGSLRIALALHEKQSRHEASNVETSARAQGAGFVVSGKKTVVVHGGQADLLIVSARVSGASRDRAGLALFAIDATASGITRRDYRTIDGQRAADIEFRDVSVDATRLIGRAGEGWEILDAVQDFGASLVCAEAIGIMEALNAQTLEYTKTRKQFGQPIARFQALQHRMVEMFMHLEQARSMAYLAAVKCAFGTVAERRRAVSAAKVRVGQAMRYVGQQAVQLHGGMGVTNELPAAHLFKRLTLLELTFGDTDHHLARFIAESVEQPAEARLRAAA